MPHTQNPNQDSYREPIEGDDMQGKAFDTLASFPQTTENPIKEIVNENVREVDGDLVFTKKIEEIEEVEEVGEIEDKVPLPPQGTSPVIPEGEVKDEAIPVKTQIKPEVVEEIKQDIESALTEETKPEVEEVKPEPEKPVETPPLLKGEYKRIKKELWDKVRPSNKTRFKLFNLEETKQNKSFLNDVCIKIIFIDDDFEDSVISEEQALFKIREVQNLLTK